MLMKWRKPLGDEKQWMIYGQHYTSELQTASFFQMSRYMAKISYEVQAKVSYEFDHLG